MGPSMRRSHLYQRGYPIVGKTYCKPATINVLYTLSLELTDCTSTKQNNDNLFGLNVLIDVLIFKVPRV